jgi:hypothetical protein
LLRWDQLWELVKYIPRYSFSKFRPGEYWGWDDDPIYGVKSYNQFGDASGHWELPRRSLKSDFIYEEGLNEDVFSLLQEVKHVVEKAGGKFIVTFPGYENSKFEEHYEKIRNIEVRLRNSGFEIAGSPKRYAMPAEYLFDSNYHLNYSGVKSRTEMLVEDLLDGGVLQ